MSIRALLSGISRMTNTYKQPVPLVISAATVVLAVMIYRQLTWCSSRLPQDDSKWSLCKHWRETNLKATCDQYPISPATPAMPYTRLNKDKKQYLWFLATHPFIAEHSVLWFVQALAGKAAKKVYLFENKCQDMITEDFTKMKSFFRNLTSFEIKKIIDSMKHPSTSEPFHSNFTKRISERYFAEEPLAETNPTTIQEIKQILIFFRNFASFEIKKIIDSMKHPSTSEPFQSDFTKWILDRHFAEQRLAGINPMTIQKITLSNEIGMNYNSLKELLNPKFNWINAVNEVLGQVTDEESLKKAISEGYLFVMYHSLSKDIRSMPDLTDSDPNRHMWEYKSPIAIFASRRDNAALMPVAIQMDAEREASVNTPQDGDDWILAKLNVQLTDYSTSQVVEHLSKVHFTIEAVCLSLERQISEYHPLYDMMRFHCRGILTLNTLGGPVLLEAKNDLDHVVEFGSEGANKLTQRAAEIIDWHDLGLKNNLKRRGVDDKTRLPFNPYRDDGLVIHDVLENMVTDYVNAFYSSNSRVTDDHELQNFAKEISKDGDGAIREFPASFTTKDSLIETFTRILWLMTGQHTAVNYPQSDYATYIPNLSTKLYDVVGVANDTFTAERLGKRKTAAEQLSLVSELSSFRMDRLFDYGSKLETSEGKKIVDFYKLKLETAIEPVLAKRNKDRLEEGHLTYPYMQPSWLTNGIQA